MKSVIIDPATLLNGEINVPGDKSISHRAVMFSALSEGRSIIDRPLLGEDVLSTITCFQALGVPIIIKEDQLIIEGQGLHGLRAPTQILNCGNSGTTLRLMMGILAAQPFDTTLTGDASLNARPMGRVMEPLEQMGATIKEERRSPTERYIHIKKSSGLKAIHYLSKIASAQVKSCLLLAGLYAEGETIVEEPSLSRNHSENLFLAKGAQIQVAGTKVAIRPSPLRALNFTVPGDISSAAFFLVAGAITSGSKILLKNVGVNPTRTGMIDVLQQMGAKLRLLQPHSIGGEAVADILVESSSLKACLVAGNLVPRLIDEIPVLAVAAAKAVGLSQFNDVAELRVKESDRIATLKHEMAKLSVSLIDSDHAFTINGPQAFKAAEFESYGDHRIAMSMAIASLVALGQSKINNVECVATSYPQFWDHLQKLGTKCRIML